MLENDPGLSIVGLCDSVPAALVLCLTAQPELVLMDVQIGKLRALDFIAEAKKLGLSPKILIVTAGMTEGEAAFLMQSGISGIVHKRNSLENLRGAIHQIASGGVYLENEYVASLLRFVDRTERMEKAALTVRENSIIRYIAEGFSNKEIGAKLAISEAAVKAAVRILFHKLGARTRAQVVKNALEKYPEQF